MSEAMTTNTRNAEKDMESSDRSMSVRYPDVLDSPDLTTVVNYIEDNYHCQEVIANNEEQMNFSFLATTNYAVTSSFLRDIQAAGYEIIAIDRAVRRNEELPLHVQCCKYNTPEGER